MVRRRPFGPQKKPTVLVKHAPVLARLLARPPAVAAGVRGSGLASEKGNFASDADARIQFGFKRARDLNAAESFQCQQSLCRTDNRTASERAGRFQTSGHQRSLKWEAVFVSGGLSVHSFASLLH